ncbi:unnamed protein product [Caretta caretta]
MLLGQAMVGTLVLPEGPELLDRKRHREQVLDSPDSNLPPSPSHWLVGAGLEHDVPLGTRAGHCGPGTAGE